MSRGESLQKLAGIIVHFLKGFTNSDTILFVNFALLLGVKFIEISAAEQLFRFDMWIPI